MKKYGLEERTLEFSKKLLMLVKSIPRSIDNYPLIKQVTKSGTSIGANYMEANGAESKNDFKHKIRISLKEARETKYWIKLLLSTNPEKANELEALLKESHELTLIFAKIIITCNTKNT